jgi:hypothetical protein
MEDSNFVFLPSPQFLELRDQNLSLDDYDSPYDSSVEGAAALYGNSSEFECMKFYQNESYYNVSCDSPTEYSVPLYGELFICTQYVCII